MSHCNENEINPSRPSFFCFTGFFFRHIFFTSLLLFYAFSHLNYGFDKSVLRISRVLSIFLVPSTSIFLVLPRTFLLLVLFSLVSLSYSMSAFSANSLGVFSFKISYLQVNNTYYLGPYEDCMFPHTDYPSNVVAPEIPPFLWVKAVFFHASREPQDEDIVAAKKALRLLPSWILL